MEFPDLGKRCFWNVCKNLDFLPFTCSYCNHVFCKDHFNTDSHKCESFKSEITKQTVIKSFVCSVDECTTCSPVEILCKKCEKHFCLTHRYHDCFDTVTDIEEKKKVWNKPREEFEESVKNVHNTINEKIKKAVENPKKKATALKIQLMRLKGKAEGTSTIPTLDRIYFLVLLPKGSQKSSKAVYVSKDWSVGRVIDSVSNMCNVLNKNNELNSPKLRLFRAKDGTQICSDLSIKIIDLIANNVIADGESLILEYIQPNEDILNFKLKDFSQYNDYL